MDKTVTINSISIGELEDLLSIMFDGISYWAEVDWNKDDYKTARKYAVEHPQKYGISFEYVIAIMLMCEQKTITIIDYDDDTEYKLDLDLIIKGVEKAINGGFWDGVDLCNADAITGDAIVQYAIFDEIVYA